ncbi:MAG TPA: NADH-quinone oxidoreductase subunit C [Pseudobdellovibrionaceae bacterium]|nr:NADH-quinone oxidoreductase subunit C [Pseudobdellovibrionaceae bacterium]
MSKLENLKQDLAGRFDIRNYEFSNAIGDDVLVLPKQDIVPVLRHFRDTGRFDFLMDICGVDWPKREKRFDVVYHLFSSKDGSRLRVKVPLAEGESVESVIGVWKGADWFEREAYDMFGIRFDNHPNLRKILTHHQFVGHPLRKDYEADAQQHCDSVLPVHFDNVEGQRGDVLNGNLIPLNIGPSHPAMHGTLRVMAEMDGETIVRAHPEIGYLHRCFEKMAETHPYNQVIPYTDRLNYCSAPSNNVGYCKASKNCWGSRSRPRRRRCA